DALVLFHDQLAITAGDVKARNFALPALGDETDASAFGFQREGIEVEVRGKDVFVGQADGLEQDRDRHLATAVDAEKQDVLGVELKVEPRAAVGNHAGREQQLSGAVRLAAVVLEEHAGRAVQL